VLFEEGTNVAEPAQQNQTIVATLRSPTTGRHSHGNMFLTGFPASYLEAGYVTTGARDAAAAVVSACTRVLETTTEPSRWHPVIFNRTSPATSEFVYSSSIRTTARVMNRRTVGRGI